MERYTVQAGEQRLTFDGELLGSGTSRTYGPSDKDRWFEIEVYRTSHGAYVVHKIGRTLFPDEEDRHTANTALTAPGAVELMYNVDRKTGVLRFPYAAEDAAWEACDRDEDFEAAFLERDLTPTRRNGWRPRKRPSRGPSLVSEPAQTVDTG